MDDARLSAALAWSAETDEAIETAQDLGRASSTAGA